MCHFLWQAQHLVKFMCHFSWQAQYLVKFKCHFSWQAQYLVKFKCHFSWQAQYSVKFGMIAGARNVVIFNRICFWRARSNLGGAAGSVLRFHGRIMVGTVSERSRIGRALEMTLQPFSANLSQILEGHFSWQAQYLVRLEGDICCSTHCK